MLASNDFFNLLQNCWNLDVIAFLEYQTQKIKTNLQGEHFEELGATGWTLSEYYEFTENVSPDE